MERIRVLCMNDDNHDSVFVTEDWHIYSNANSFITHRLAQPHTDTYEVRGFHLCDHEEIPGIDNEEDVILLFDAVCGYTDVHLDDWHLAFETLWKYSSEWWHA